MQYCCKLQVLKHFSWFINRKQRTFESEIAPMCIRACLCVCVRVRVLGIFRTHLCFEFAGTGEDSTSLTPSITHSIPRITTTWQPWKNRHYTWHVYNKHGLRNPLFQIHVVCPNGLHSVWDKIFEPLWFCHTQPQVIGYQEKSSRIKGKLMYQIRKRFMQINVCKQIQTLQSICNDPLSWIP